nr:hypothetical protein [Tanacetum cinerariifolium]
MIETGIMCLATIIFRLEQEDAKRQRIEEDNEFAELKRCLEIIPEDDDDVTIEATPLSSKSSTIVDYKIYKEGKKSFFKIIRADVFIRSFVIWERVHDFQLGIESYQHKVNLTAPTIYFPEVEKHEMFSIIYELVHGIIYKNSKKEKRVMRHSEIHMFCDATMNRLLEVLKSYNNDVRYGYNQRNLTKDEVEYVKLFEEEIEDRLMYRMQMRRLVPLCFVIFDLEPLSLSFDFVISSKIFKSLSFNHDRLFHLEILCLNHHAYTFHHLESLLAISLDRLDILKEDLVYQSLRKSLYLILKLS